MHDHAPRGSATLAGRADRAEENRLRRHFEIGARADDQRVVAAEFHDGFAEPAVNRFRDVESHRDRTGRGNQRNAAIVGQFFAQRSCRSPISKVKIAGSAPVSRQTRSAIFVTAIAVSGVFSDGFQTVASPQTAASAAFHDQTATGKLKALITATTPSGCHCSISR